MTGIWQDDRTTGWQTEDPRWIYDKLVGFGRACAPVRARALCAPVFFSSLPRQTGRCAPFPAHRSFAASQKYIKSIELGPPTSKAFFFPQDHRGYEKWGPLPQPRPSQLCWFFRQYFGVKIMYRCDHTPKFLLIFPFLYSFWIFLFVLIFFFFSPF